MENLEYIHVPYAVVLIKACTKWRAEHDGAMPANFGEKKLFLQMIKSMKRFTVSENFEEAEATYTDCFKSQTRLPDNITTILDDFEDLTNGSSDHFWLMVRALK